VRRELQTAEELRWEASGPEVLHFSRPNGWSCAMNFGTDPAPRPQGQIVLSSGTGPVVDVLPGETTVWLTRPRPV
jgi:alpha-glucosidase